MSSIHVCSLHQRDTSGLPKLAPNASFCRRLARRFRKLIILNPNHFKCHSFSYNKSVIMSEQKRHIKSRYNYIIHPFSTLSMVQEVFFFLVWTSKMVSMPLLGNIITSDIITDITALGLVILHVILHVMQHIIVISFFFLGYLDVNTKEVVIEPKRVICRYLKTYFVFDFCASDLLLRLSLFVLLILFRNRELLWYSYTICDCLTYSCLYARLNTILNYLNNIGLLMKLGKKTRTIIVHALRTFMYLHFFTCMLYYIPKLIYQREWPNDSWIKVAKIHPKSGAAAIEIYSECLLMTICFFFGAEQKYHVHQTTEQVLLSIVSIFGRLYTLYMIADILRVFGIAGLSQSSYEREISQIKQYMRTKDFPLAMRNKMIRYFEYKFQKRYFDEQEMLNGLSGHLRTEIFLFFGKAILKKCTIFNYVPHSKMATLLSEMQLETFMPGDVIYKTGQLVRHLYFISTGTVLVLNEDGMELSHLEDGDFFGLCTLLVGKETHSILVLEATDVFTIETDAFLTFLEAYPDAMEYLYKVARDRWTSYQQQEQISKREKSGCLDDVRNGRLLEKRRERTKI